MDFGHAGLPGRADTAAATFRAIHVLPRAVDA
jgi:hypothetical protein